MSESELPHTAEDDVALDQQMHSLYNTPAGAPRKLNLHGLGRIGNLDVATTHWPPQYRTFFFFRVADEPVGFAILQQGGRAGQGEQSAITIIYLHTPYRQQGFATAFYRFLMDKGVDLEPDTKQSAGGAAVWRKLGQNTPESQLNELQIICEAFDPKDVVIRRLGDSFVAFWNDQKIGYVTLDMYDKSVAPDARHIHKSGVWDSFRRKGVATQLYNAAADWLQRDGLRLVPSPESILSDEALAFWKKRDPAALAKDSRLNPSSDIGKTITYKGDQWTIYRVGAKYAHIKKTDGSDITSLIPNTLMASLTLTEAADSTSGWRLVSIDDLPKQTIYDICALIAERHPYFANDPDPEFVKASLAGLADAPKIWLGQQPVAELFRTMQRQNSASAVSKYAAQLSDKNFEFDPIFIANGKFLDGGHRMEAYAKVGRKTIPVVDISHLLNASVEQWEDWMEGVEGSQFDPASR